MRLYQAKKGRFWACCRRSLGCGFGFGAGPNDIPARHSVHEAPDRAADIARVRDQLVQLAWMRLETGTPDYDVERNDAGEVTDPPATYYHVLGLILEAEDLVTLGNIRKALDVRT